VAGLAQPRSLVVLALALALFAFGLRAGWAVFIGPAMKNGLIERATIRPGGRSSCTGCRGGLVGVSAPSISGRWPGAAGAGAAGHAVALDRTAAAEIREVVLILLLAAHLSGGFCACSRWSSLPCAAGQKTLLAWAAARRSPRASRSRWRCRAWPFPGSSD